MAQSMLQALLRNPLESAFILLTLNVLAIVFVLLWVLFFRRPSAPSGAHSTSDRADEGLDATAPPAMAHADLAEPQRDPFKDLNRQLAQHSDPAKPAREPAPEIHDPEASIITEGMDAPGDALLRRLWLSISSIKRPRAAETAAAGRTLHNYWEAILAALQPLHDASQPLERRKQSYHTPSIFARVERPDWVFAPPWHAVPNASSAELVLEVAGQGKGGDATARAKAHLVQRCAGRLTDLEMSTATLDDTVMMWRFVAVCVQHTTVSFLLLRIRKEPSTNTFAPVWYHTDWFPFAKASSAPGLGTRILCKLLHATHDQLGYRVVRRDAVMGGKYHVDKILGSGAFCDVYEVRGGVRGARAVAKVIRYSDKKWETLNREITALRELQACEYIPKLVDSDETCLILQPVGTPLPVVLDELYAAFPEWHYNGTVQPEALRRQRVQLAQEVLRDVSEALKLAHSKRIHHADVQLPNILRVDEGGCRRFVLADWGVSRTLTPVAATHETKTLHSIVAVIAGPTDGHSQDEVDEWFARRFSRPPHVAEALLEFLARRPAAAKPDEHLTEPHVTKDATTVMMVQRHRR